MKIVGLVSSFREGPMLATAIRSLAALDHVLVFEGPVEGNPEVGPKSVVPKDQRVTFVEGSWESDAAKRTAMVEWVQARRWLDGETWGLWLDGDEILLWGEYLHDWVWRVSQQGDEDDPVGGWPFPLVELNGLTILCLGKLIRLDLVSRYLISSSYVEFKTGIRKTLGNMDVWTPVDGALIKDEKTGLPWWRARPPLAGEPHLLHRPVLRSKVRDDAVERQGAAEERNFQGVDLEAPTGIG